MEGTTDGPIDDDRTLLYDAAGADDDGACDGEYGRLWVDDGPCGEVGVSRTQKTDGEGRTWNEATRGIT